MRVVCLVKAVPDYEISTKDFEIENNRAHKRYNRMIGLYDEYSIELGVQLKEKYEAELKIISYCDLKDIPVLRKAIAMGGDDLIIISGTSDDPNIITNNLLVAIEKIGKVDLILAGRQSSDMDRGIVPGLLAGLLAIPFIPNAVKIEQENNEMYITQVSEKGSNILRVKAPVVLSITDDRAIKPRIPNVKGIFLAKKKPVTMIEAKTFEMMNLEEIKVEIPKNEYICEKLPSEDFDETAHILWNRLKEEKYI